MDVDIEILSRELCSIHIALDITPALSLSEDFSIPKGLQCLTHCITDNQNYWKYYKTWSTGYSHTQCTRGGWFMATGLVYHPDLDDVTCFLFTRENVLNTSANYSLSGLLG